MRKHRLKHSILWILLENAVAMLAAFILIASARAMGTHAFGLASIAFFVGSLAETLVATPFAESLIQRRWMSVSVIDTAHTAMVCLGLAVWLALVALGPVFAWLYKEPALSALIALQGTTCLLLGLRGAQEAVLARKLRFKALSLRSIAAKCFGAFVCAGCAVAGAGAWSLILGNVAYAATATGMIYFSTPRKPRLRGRMSEARELFSFGGFTLLDALLWTATPRLFGFLASYFHGVSAAGLLNIAFRINDTICSIIAAISARLALPLFARIAHDRQRLGEAFAKGTRATFLVAAPAFAGLALVGREVIALTLGAQWAGAAPALGIVCFYSLFNFARLLAQPAIKALGRPALLIWLHVVGLGYIAVGCLAAAPFSLDAQLLVWALFGFVYYAASAVLLRRASGLGWLAQSRPLWPGALAALGMTASLLLLQPHLAAWPAFPSLAVKVAVGGAVYVCLALIIERRHVGPVAGPYLRILSRIASRS